MKAEYINPFIQGIHEIFNEVTHIPLSVTGKSLKKTKKASGNLVIMIGITGDLKGNVAINLDEQVAKRIASNMMGGMPVETLNEIAISAVSELGNMIMGRVSTFFSHRNIAIDITPPTLLRGEKLEINYSTFPLLTICFSSEDIQIHFDIAIHEKSEEQ